MCQTPRETKSPAQLSGPAQEPGPEAWQNLPKVKAKLQKRSPILNVLHLTNQCL